MKHFTFFFPLLASVVLLAETVGVRPYEMDWAGRTTDTYPDKVLEDFESEGWTGECSGGDIVVERSRERQLFGDYVLKATYKNTADGSQIYYLRPPEPLKAPDEFDTVTLWGHGNQEALYKDRRTIGIVVVHVELRNAEGKTTEVEMAGVNWNDWFLCHKRLTPEQQEEFSRPGTTVTAIVLKPANNREPRTLYFDSLTLYTEEFKPLTFEPRPKRGIPLFPGQDPGANTGEGTLPFPTREDTILPDSAGNNAQISVYKEDNAFIMKYSSDDGELQIAYTPQTGTWSDFTASWNGCPPFQPLFDGGARFGGGQRPAARLLSCDLEDGKVKAVWSYTLADGLEHEVTYQFCLKGKTLVLDTLSSNGDNRLEVVSYGEIRGVKYKDLVQIPYYDYGPVAGRPAVALVQAGDETFFLSGHTDWYLSNASRPQGGQFPYDNKLQFNGQVTYIPKTDGKRNDVYERFFVTVSPVFEEHLPNIPNPKSPWKHITGSIVWRAHGASNRAKDKECWYNVWRHGMRKCLVTDHETMWRDGEESFTFRTRTAPGKGGDEGERDYARYMQDTLGFVYGPYNNFTDFAPVNEYWDTDMVARSMNNQLARAWRRCYGPKPLRGVEFCERLTPVIQEKFHFSTAYCDVHTSSPPWDRCDFDFRVPGAATFAQTYYAYGEIMLIQKHNWNGPVYSEGPHFCFFSGLTDGNYAQDRTYRLFSRPWLVDFDLRKIHEQECNFGIGAMTMFYGEGTQGEDQYGWLHDGRTDEHLDRFFAAIAAFGHPGFLVMEGGIRIAMRSYYLLQQIETQYTQAGVKDIFYCTPDGRLCNTSEAIKNGAYRNSQLVIDYDNGTHVVANGSGTLPMNVTHAGREVALQPNSFMAWTDDGRYLATNAQHNGFVCDYVESPEYIFLDGRDKMNHTMPKADGSGCVVCRNDDAEHWEFIGVNGAQGGFAVQGGNARAYAHDGTDLGPAKAVRCRGMLYVLPVEGAFSYKLEKNATTPETKLSSDSYEIFSGETVTIRTPKGMVERVVSGEPGQRVWVEIDGQYLCFVIRRLVEFTQVGLSPNESELRGVIRNCGGTPVALQVKPSFSKPFAIELPPYGSQSFAVRLPVATAEGEEKISVELSRGELCQTWKGTLVRKMTTEMIFDGFAKASNFSKGAVIRAKTTDADPFGLGARVEVQTMSCGNVSRKGVFTHPPYRDGCAGDTFASYQLELPKVRDIVLTGFVGKKDGSHPGDGIIFLVGVTPEGYDFESIVAEKHVTRNEWVPIEADLSQWAGKKIRLRLIMPVGSKLNTAGDWGCWGDLKITRKEPRLKTTLK
ncbi:MAG: hypothetical protein IKO65_08020 [Victivallales bacterium]|nr:hypothetical protein [Victivallales bacterium]